MATHITTPTLAAGLEMMLVQSPAYASQLARLRFAAFRDNELNALLYPASSNKHDIVAWLEERERRDLMSKRSTIVAIVDTTNHDEIIACAKWKIPSSRSNGVTCSDSLTHQAASDTGSLSKDDVQPYPHGTNVAMHTHFGDILHQHRKTYFDAEHDYALGTLYTHPSYQGRGCASAMLHWGIQQADADGAKIFLESSPQAHSLYMKYGWVDVDRTVIDLGQFGGKGLYPLTIMVRDPVVSNS